MNSIGLPFEPSELFFNYYVFGAGELSRVMVDYLSNYPPLRGIPHGLTVDREFLQKGCSWYSGAIYGFGAELKNRIENKYRTGMYLPIGYQNMNQNRKKVFNKCLEFKIDPLSFIHSKAEILGTVGMGCWIQEHVNIQSGVELGHGVVCWAGAHVGHGSKIGSFSWVTTNSTICGQVKLGKNCFIGANAVIAPGVTLANRTLVAAGAVVSKDSEEGDVFLFGNNNKHTTKKSWEIDL
jgi:acetyltransferase-like isoleucine patch superfamily enzyme